MRTTGPPVETPTVPVPVDDADGPLTLTRRPERIVSMSASVTR
jgi:ABC-type Fe2+-enterobactin transport system substrate-binding protein